MTQTEALLRLQEIDLALAQIAAAVEALPERAKLAQAKEARKKISKELTKLTGVLKDLEMDISDNRAEHAAAEQSVKTAQAKVEEKKDDYRALRDFELQLSNLAKRLEKLDFDQGGLVEKRDETRSQIDKLQELDSKLEAQEKSLLASAKGQLESFQAQKGELVSERADIAPLLGEALLARYEKARVRFQGRAVEVLDGNRPTSCRVALQPASIADLRRREPITECPYCRRILVLGDPEEL